jgi:hypothetical protein
LKKEKREETKKKEGMFSHLSAAISRARALTKAT